MDEKLHILIFEKDESFGVLLREYLQSHHFETDLTFDPEKALALFTGKIHDMCILSASPREQDGLILARKIKTRPDDNTSILFIGDQSTPRNILEGFKAGADDYMQKPVCMEELLLRIKSIFRRTRGLNTQSCSFFQLGKFLFDVQRQTLIINDELLRLTTKESALLHIFCSHANRIVERKTVLNAVWRNDNYFNARSMDVYISKLRKLLRDDESLQILNIHGYGYKLVTSPENI